MNRKEKLDIAISLLKMAREQLELNYSEFNTARFVDEIRLSFKYTIVTDSKLWVKKLWKKVQTFVTSS